jgi:hypothetical protein
LYEDTASSGAIWLTFGFPATVATIKTFVSGVAIDGTYPAEESLEALITFIADVSLRDSARRC